MMIHAQRNGQRRSLGRLCRPGIPPILKALFLLCILCASTALAQTPSSQSGLIAGVNYRALSEAQPVEAAPGTVEVIEFFWYDCETCFVIEPALGHWLESQQGKVTFRRVPAVVGTYMLYFARAYYTAEALGLLDRMHEPLYEALHREGRPLEREDELAAFFAEHGVEHNRFLSTFRGARVAEAVRNAQTLSRTYELAGAPTFIVAGKYRVDPTMAANASALVQTVAALADRERTK